MKCIHLQKVRYFYWLCFCITMLKSFQNDCELLGFILALPNISARSRFIQRYLRPADQHRLCVHVANLVQGHKSHRLPDDNLHQALIRALSPQKKSLVRLIKRVRDPTRRRHWDLNRQKGGAIFSVILAGLIPLISDIIIRAATKKK